LPAGFAFAYLAVLGPEEEHAHAGHDHQDADKLLHHDHFVQDEIGEDAGADGFAEDAHRHRRCGHLFQQQIEDELPANGGKERQPGKGRPGLPAEAGKRLAQQQYVNQQDAGADQIAEHGISNGRNVLAYRFADEEIQRDHPGRHESEDIAKETPAADLEIARADNKAAAQRDGAAHQRRGAYLLLADEALQPQRKQRLQADDDRRAGNRGEIERLEPHHIMQRQKEAGGKYLLPLARLQGGKFAPAAAAEEEKGQQYQPRHQHAVKSDHRRGRIGQLHKNRRTGESQHPAEQDQIRFRLGIHTLTCPCRSIIYCLLYAISAAEARTKAAATSSAAIPAR